MTTVCGGTHVQGRSAQGHVPFPLSVGAGLLALPPRWLSCLGPAAGKTAEGPLGSVPCCLPASPPATCPHWPGRPDSEKTGLEWVADNWHFKRSHCFNQRLVVIDSFPFLCIKHLRKYGQGLPRILTMPVVPRTFSSAPGCQRSACTPLAAVPISTLGASALGRDDTQ